MPPNPSTDGVVRLVQVVPPLVVAMMMLIGPLIPSAKQVVVDGQETLLGRSPEGIVCATHVAPPLVVAIVVEPTP